MPPSAVNGFFGDASPTLLSLARFVIAAALKYGALVSLMSECKNL